MLSRSLFWQLAQWSPSTGTLHLFASGSPAGSPEPFLPHLPHRSYFVTVPSASDNDTAKRSTLPLGFKNGSLGAQSFQAMAQTNAEQRSPSLFVIPPPPAQIFPIASRIPYHHILNMTPTSIRRLKVPLSCKTPPPRRSIPIKRDTYKFQSYGDYSRTIRIYGTTDSYSTEPVCDLMYYRQPLTYAVVWSRTSDTQIKVYSNKPEAVRQTTDKNRAPTNSYQTDSWMS